MSLTLLIVLVTVAASFYAWNDPRTFQNWMMNPYEINRRNEYWRFLTSGLIHADYMHLFFNMFALYGFGQFMEMGFFKYNYGDQTGGLYYLLLYFGGVILSDLPSFLEHRQHAHYNSLGASGGVSSVIFGSVLLEPFQRISFYFIPMPGVIFAVLYVWYSIYMGKKGMDNVNHKAHLYGALWGVVMVALVYPQAVPNFASQILNWRF